MVDLGRWVNEEYRVPGEAAQVPNHPDPSTSPEAVARQETE